MNSPRSSAPGALQNLILCRTTPGFLPPLMPCSSLTHSFRPGQGPLGSQIFIVARGSPTIAPSTFRRTHTSVQFTATVDTLVFRRGGQHVIYMMTCSPLYAPEDLKVLIREGIIKLCPQDLCNPSTRHSSFSWRLKNQAQRANASWWRISPIANRERLRHLEATSTRSDATVPNNASRKQIYNNQTTPP